MKSALLAIAFFFVTPCLAEESQLREVRAIDGKVYCNAYHNWIVTTTSGPCGRFTAPVKVAVGATFAADGQERTIRVIRAQTALQDLGRYGAETKKGELYCVAAETDYDLDQEHNDHALWLFIPKCEIVEKTDHSESVGERIIETIPANEFLKLPLKFQATYIGGLLEGMSYAYYGDSMPDYPKFAACAREKTLGDTTQDVVAFLEQQQQFDEGVSAALAMTLGKRCKH